MICRPVERASANDRFRRTDISAQALAVAGKLPEERVEVHRLRTVDALQQPVPTRQLLAQTMAQSFAIDQVHHPQSAARGLVAVGRTDPAQGRANRAFAALLFVEPIEDRVIRHHDVGAL